MIGESTMKKIRLFALITAGILCFTALTACALTTPREVPTAGGSVGETTGPAGELNNSDLEKERIALAVAIEMYYNNIDFSEIDNQYSIWNVIGWYSAIRSAESLEVFPVTESEIAEIQKVITGGDFIPHYTTYCEDNYVTTTEIDGETAYIFEQHKDFFGSMFGQSYSYQSTKNDEGSLVILLTEYIGESEITGEYTFDFTDTDNGSENHNYCISAMGFNDLTEMYESTGTIATFTIDELAEANNTHALIDKFGAFSTSNISVYREYTTTYYSRDGIYASIWTELYRDGSETTESCGGWYNGISYSDAETDGIMAYISLDNFYEFYSEPFSGYEYLFEYGTPYILEETDEHYKFEIVSEYTLNHAEPCIYTVMKNDLRLVSIDYRDGSFMYFTYDNVVVDERKMLDCWDNNKLRTVTYILDDYLPIGTRKTTTTISIPENWNLQVDEYYGYEYADKNLSAPFEYPGDYSGDYTVYVSYAVG